VIKDAWRHQRVVSDLMMGLTGVEICRAWAVAMQAAMWRSLVRKNMSMRLTCDECKLIRKAETMLGE